MPCVVVDMWLECTTRLERSFTLKGDSSAAGESPKGEAAAESSRGSSAAVLLTGLEMHVAGFEVGTGPE